MNVTTVRRPRTLGKGEEAWCPRCRSWIKAGELVINAPGRGHVLKHVDCPKKEAP